MPSPSVSTPAAAFSSRRPWTWSRGVWLAVLLIAVLTALAMAVRVRHETATQGALAEAVTRLAADDVAHWLAERRRVAGVLAGSPDVGELYVAATASGGSEPAVRLQRRLAEIGQAAAAESVLLIGAGGAVVFAEPGAERAVSPVLADTARRALKAHSVENSGFYALPGTAAAKRRLDVVVPLRSTAGPADAAAVLRFDPMAQLIPSLDEWHVPTRTGKTFLLQREGDTLVGVEDGRQIPLASPDLGVARVIRGELPAGRAIEAPGPNGEMQIGAALPVGSSPWWLVARIDRSEALQAAAPDLLLIAVLGLIAAVAAVNAIHRAGDRLALNEARDRSAKQGEQLKALRLLDSAAGQLPEVIFAKDLEGRYLFFNHEGARAFGFDHGQVIGKTVHDLLPPDTAELSSAEDAQVMASNAPLETESFRDTVDGRRTFLVTRHPLHDEQGRVMGLFGIARDITERQAALGSQALLAAIVESSADAILCQDLEGRVTSANPAAERMFGFSVAEALGRLGRELSPGTRLGDLRERIEAGQTVRVPHVVRRHRDGHDLHVSLTMSPVRDPAGKVIAVSTIARDIGDRVAMERELRERGEALERAQTIARLGHLIIGNGGRLESWSTTMPGLIRRRDEEIPPTLRDWLDWVDPEQREQTRRNLFEVGRSGRTGEFDYRLQRGDGVWIDIRHVAVPIEAAAGDGSVRWFSTLQDVTAQKALETSLERHTHHLEELVAERSSALQRAVRTLSGTESFLRTLADHLPGRVAYWDAECVCRFVNKSYREHLGRLPEQLVGRTMDQIYGTTAWPERSARVEAVLAGEAQHFESEDLNSDGTSVVSWLHYIPDFEGDKVRGFIVLANDITEMKRAERSLRASNQALVQARGSAEAASVAKSAFLANMSHEIRTPMNAIIGLTHLLRRDVQEPVQQDRLHKVDDAARHLLGVINDILDLSKIESGKLKLDNADFETDALFSRAAGLVAEQAREKGIELVIDIDGLPATMHGDATRLSQALLNYLSNAVKFTQQGSITLRARCIDREAEMLNVRFEVQDTGIGIAADRIGEIFNAFEQADSSTTRRFGGTGLGLAIARQLAQLMQGEAGASSEPGVGSLFWFTARLTRAARSTTTRSRALAGVRVLLADDLPDARDALSHMMRRFGIHADTAADGEQTLAMAEAAARAGTPYDVHVLDWKMAGFDDIELARRLHARHGGGTRFILVSAYDDASLAALAHAAGILRVLPKPVAASALHDALLEVLAGTAPRAAAPPSRTRAGPGDAFETLRATRAGARVLLAEDNLVNRELAVELLRSAGLEVEVAGDGTEAIALGAHGDYDLILMDMQMPRVDGLEATRALRADPATARTPIVAMTANAFGEDRAACLAAGMNDHVAKPVDPQTLYATLLRWLAPRMADTRSASLDEAVGSRADEPVAIDVYSRLAAIGDLDVARGLQLFDGQAELYLRVLRRFVESYGEGMKQLDEPLAAGDAVGMAAAAHSLRGASASIGATRVAELAGDLEVLGKNVASAAEMTPAAMALQHGLAELIARIGAALAAERRALSAASPDHEKARP